MQMSGISELSLGGENKNSPLLDIKKSNKKKKEVGFDRKHTAAMDDEHAITS